MQRKKVRSTATAIYAVTAFMCLALGLTYGIWFFASPETSPKIYYLFRGYGGESAQ